jgi:hypothetical protein
MNPLVFETLTISTKQAINAKRMMLAFINDEATSSLINASIAMDEAQLKTFDAHKKLVVAAQAPVEAPKAPVEAPVEAPKAPVEAPKAPKRKLSPAQQQWLDEVSAVMKELPELSIEEARREASRRREEGFDETKEYVEPDVELPCNCPMCEEDDELDELFTKLNEELDELDDLDDDDEEYVEEKAPRSFHQKRWNNEVAAVMKEFPEMSIKEASKLASDRRNGLTLIPTL